MDSYYKPLLIELCNYSDDKELPELQWAADFCQSPEPDPTKYTLPLHMWEWQECKEEEQNKDLFKGSAFRYLFFVLRNSVQPPPALHL